MTGRLATFLYAFAGWTVFVWAVFIRNVSRDHTHGTAFKVVHLSLAGISLAFAATTVWLVFRTRRTSAQLSQAADDPAESERVRHRTG